MTAPITPKFVCSHCDCTFTRKYNLERHIVRKHIDSEMDESRNLGENSSLLGTESRNLGENSSLLGDESRNLGTDEHCFECVKCSRGFSSQWYLTKHIEKCKEAIYQYTCQQCNKKFKHNKSQYKHSKVCKSKALIPVEPVLPIVATNMNHIETQNIETQNNTYNNNNNTQNNNTYNIIVYNHDKTQFKQEHITPELINKIIRDHQTDTQIIQEFSREMMAHPENQCIKKDDLKSAHSKVHIGNNQWITKRDESIYPNLVNTISNEMSETINKYKHTLEILQTRYKQLLRETDYMADNGYINTDNIELQKEKRRNYLQLIKFLKVAIHNHTQLSKKVPKVILD